MEMKQSPNSAAMNVQVLTARRRWCSLVEYVVQNKQQITVLNGRSKNRILKCRKQKYPGHGT